MALPPSRRPESSGSNLPERRVSNEELEQVIRRAAELQARDAERESGDSLTETELLRIGQEIGLSGQYLRRALAEVSADAAPKPTAVTRILGPEKVSASRTVPGDADEVRVKLDEYLVTREWLAAVRRFPDLTIYERARGTDLARILRVAQDAFMGAGAGPQVGAGFELRKARQVEIAVQPLEEGYSYATLTADLSGMRAGFAAGGWIGGVGGGSAVAAVLGIAVDPTAALLGVPVLAGSVWGMRAAYDSIAARAALHLESLLDSLERGEELVSGRARRGRRG